MSYIQKIISVVLLFSLSSLSIAAYHSNHYHYHYPTHYYHNDYAPVEEYYYEEVEVAPMTNSNIGGIVGAIAGGLLGSTVGGGNGKILAIAAGSVAGALIGSSVGRNMDENDLNRVDLALENNSVGQPAYWRNEHSGIQYNVVPTRNVNKKGYRYCREFRTVADIGGKKQQMYGTACRQPDGSWKIVK